MQPAHLRGNSRNPALQLEHHEKKNAGGRVISWNALDVCVDDFLIHKRCFLHLAVSETAFVFGKQQLLSVLTICCGQLSATLWKTKVIL